MLSSTSIAELAENLRRLQSGTPDAEIVRWLRAASPDAAKIPVPIACDPKRSYSRTLLYKSAAFEILVIHWRPGCVSAIHDHGGAHCWLAVSDGTMHVDNYVRKDSGKEEGYAALRLEGREHLTAGGIDYRNDDVHLHRCATSAAPATTLHVYAKPISRFNAFDEKTYAISEIVSAYDADLT
ncbi:MAG TPA: cysteine dioxygenase family protein [Candidatus Baltobacteraceae bacterium]|nr:cysteine dioxygenase family protein [Candidatus Baltobacteraceae bacterium]